MIRRMALVSFLASLLLLSAASADQSVTVANVTVGGVNHLVVYPLNDSSKATRVEAALPTIITTYETLWKSKNQANGPIPFQLLIDTELEAPNGNDLSDAAFEAVKLPVPSAPAEWTGATEGSQTTACHIKLFDASSLNSPNELEFELAIDTARCYLLHYISAELQDWWYEGLARWMAVQVYSPPPFALASLQKDYGDNYNTNVFNSGPEALYFWEFLLGTQIQNPPFSDLPTLAQSFGNAPKQFLLLTPDLFYSYVNVVAGDGLPWQPAADDLAEEKNLSLSLPVDVELDLEENSISITTVKLPKLEEGKGVTIMGDGLARSGTIVGIGSTGSFVPIADGESLDLCDQSELTVIAGRAVPSEASSTAVSKPSLKVSLKNDCAKAKIPPCLVGTWQQDVPFTGKFVSLDGTLQHTLRADGSFTQVYSNYVVTYNLPNQPSSNITYVTTTFSGNMTLEPDPKITGRYNVTSWHRHMEAGGEVIQTAGGKTRDVTSAITEKYFGDSVPSYYQCVVDSAKNSQWTGHLTGNNVEALGVTDLTFKRVS
jgi:hypothetical protein